MSRFPQLFPVGGSVGDTYLKGAGNGWDIVLVGSQQFPGKARLTKGGLKLKKDHKKKAGADGSRPTFHGLEGEEFEIKCTVWTQAQLDALAQLCDVIAPQPGGKPRPVSVSAPHAKHLKGVASMVVIEVGLLTPSTEVHGGMELVIKLLHWIPQGNQANAATSTPTRSVRNQRREDAQKRNPPNPLPTQQSGTCGPSSGGASASF